VRVEMSLRDHPVQGAIRD